MEFDLNIIAGEVLRLMGEKELPMNKAFDEVSDKYGLDKIDQWYDDKTHYMHTAWRACVAARIPIVEYYEQKKADEAGPEPPKADKYKKGK